MMNLPSLNLLERWAMHLLIRSPRVTLLVVKEFTSSEIFCAADPRDPIAMFVTRGTKGTQDQEPLSMQFERIFHQPSYGEKE
jgi:hypothetical protein